MSRGRRGPGLLALAAVAAVSLAVSELPLNAQFAICSVNTTAVGFGTYDALAGSPLDGQGSVRFSCLGGFVPMIRITINTGSAGNFDRRMSGPATLRYNLFLDGGRQTIWGDGSGGTQAYIHRNIILLAVYEITVYGRIPAGQDVPSGSYGDQLIVTLEQ